MMFKITILRQSNIVNENVKSGTYYTMKCLFPLAVQ